MASNQLSTEELGSLAELASGWGKIIVQRVAQQHQLLGLDFRSLEQIAQTAAAGLLSGILEQFSQQQADALDPLQPCPQCQRLCPLTREDRPLQVEGGTAFTLHEPLAHCPDCRRDFFPPTHPTRPGQP